MHLVCGFTAPVHILLGHMAPGRLRRAGRRAPPGAEGGGPGVARSCWWRSGRRRSKRRSLSMPPGPVRVLMVSSEVESLARTGGLGDAVEALSRSLASLGRGRRRRDAEVRRDARACGVRPWPGPVVAPLGLGHARTLGVLEARLGGPAGARAPRDAANRAPRAMLLCDAQLFDRDGIYGDRRGSFTDNPFRFAALSSGALSVAERAWDGALPDVVHAHDWHAALSILYARRVRGPAWSRVPTVLTIHNLAFQGVVAPSELDYLAIPRDAWDSGWIRHDGAVNLMKGGIELADRVTTVSETYAREIQRWPHGYGLDAHLRWHSGKLVGIVNGIDTESFDPSTDGAIARRYGQADAIEGKRACKQALCAELGLDGDGPLFGVVSRLQWLKGIDLLLAILPALVERGAQGGVRGHGRARPRRGAAQRCLAVARANRHAHRVRSRCSRAASSRAPTSSRFRPATSRAG